MKADFVAAAAGKWLMGPLGIGFTAWRPELLERIEPLLVGTGSVENRLEYFSPELRYAKTARRFEESAASWLDVAAFAAAVGLLMEIGIEQVSERVLDLAGRLAKGLVESGHQIIEPWPRSRAESSGIVSFRHPKVASEELLRELVGAGVITRIHRDFVRLSPHFYNTEQEVNRVVALLARMAAAS